MDTKSVKSELTATDILELNELKMLADSGDGIAALKTAKLLHTAGDNVGAVKYCTLAVDRNIAEAQYLLGTYYDFGIVKEDAERAAELYRLAAEQGYAPAQNNLGGCLRDGRGVEQNPEEAVRLFSCAASKGDANACFRMAVCLRDGVGIEQDSKKAFEYLYNSAKLGHIQALGMLGDCYLGKGVFQNSAPDPIRAFECFKLAAENGSDECRYKLGVCYRDGLGVTADKEAALNCFKTASECGNAQATYELGVCYLENGDYKEAVECFNKTVSCDKSLPESMYRLAYCYVTGKGIGKDISAAMWLLSRASTEGCAEAYNLLGDCHYFGIGCEVNRTEAVKAYLEANKRGSRYAAGMLGLCCEYGDGTAKNMQYAQVMYRKAALCGDFDGTARLGISLCRDKSTLQNGIEYLKLASEHNSISATVELARVEYKMNPSGDSWKKYYELAIESQSRTAEDFSDVSNERIEMYLKNDEEIRVGAMYELALHYLENMCEERALIDSLQPTDLENTVAKGKAKKSKKSPLSDAKATSISRLGIVFANAYEYLSRAALQGYDRAVSVLSNLYSSRDVGIYIFSSEFKDYVTSLLKTDDKPEKSAQDVRNDTEYAEVYNKLGEDYFIGNLVRVNKANAVKCFRIAAKLGSSGAQYSLGWCLKNGEGVAVDYEEAKKWLTVSAIAGNADACYSLGDCYDKGLGMRVRNRSEAKKWYVKAANRGNNQAARILAAHKDKD